MVKIAGDNHKTRVKNTQKITSGIDKHKISCQNIIKIQDIVVHYKNYQAKPVMLTRSAQGIDKSSDLEALTTMIANQRFCSLCSTAYRITEAHPPSCPKEKTRTNLV
jgi:hypothetical protein